MNRIELYEYLKQNPNGNVQEVNFKKKYPEHYIIICNMDFPDDFTFQQKLFHYLNNDPELKLGICPVCGNRCKYRRINEGYNSHCSTTCSSKDIVVQNKLIETNKNKYGFDYSSKNPYVKSKKEATNIDRYGFSNPIKSKVVRDKIISTNLKKYGKPNYSQTYLFTKQHKKKILYDGIYFDSSWEVIVYRYCIMTNKDVEYNPDVLYKYEYDGKEYYYQPDFKIGDEIYEVKGEQFFKDGKMVNPYDHSQDDKYEEKHQCMIHNGVHIIREEEINNMKDKLELFEYLRTIEDKSGGFKKEDSIKKNYPDLYKEMMELSFPDNYTFIQKLWHFLQDDYSIHRCECGNELHFIDFKKGYRKYCSKECPCVAEYNKLTLSKAQIASRSKESREKAVNTILEKNGGQFWSDENFERLKQGYKNNKDRCNKLKDFYKNNYENRCNKIKETIKKHIEEYVDLTGVKPSGSVSEIEISFYKYLTFLFGKDNFDIQHYSDVYPYSCDFYIPYINLYIEIQGNWTHGNKPFEGTEEDNEKLELWKSKDNEYYNNAIYTWTDLDVRKRNIAKKNHLNYIEIYSNDINECITIFNDYLKSMIVEYCLLQEFPGNPKWVAEHPIWDCNVSNKVSPRYAWYNKIYLVKAVNNVFKIFEKDDMVRDRFIREFLMCDIEDNHIVNSTKRFLELILNRFTIAKIAPKVTALSSDAAKKIIDDSGIDISNGVYIPMAGFGGIKCAAEMWYNEHNIDSNGLIECYDINDNFCDWYGWNKRDMLEQKVKTDKVCIVCPPFGKKYEHWDGTPRDMSNKSFIEWYKLIKEYVDAPNYIIIGPEIDKTGTGSNKGFDSNGNKREGLFSKTTGVMVWTDEMIKREK